MLKRAARAASRAGLFGRAGILLGMADRSRDARQWTEAAAFYGAYLKLRPNHPAIWVQYGHALKESGHLTEGEAAYRQALALRPDVADTYLQLGHVLKVSGRLDEAEEAYSQALRLDPGNPQTRTEMRTLYGASASAKLPIKGQDLENDIPPSDSTAGFDEYDPDVLAAISEGENAPPSDVIFDVSDLIAYFRDSRLPTGIQRVQTEVICALLGQQSEAGKKIGVCAFAERKDRWARIPDALFLKVCALTRTGSSTTDPEWVKGVRQITAVVRASKPMQFPPGAVIVNLGTSWWLQNYFLNVKNAKAEFGVRYVPFVHDLIPIVTPEHCARGLTEEFVTWILGVFDHADHFLVNSESTRRDLLAAAKTLGHELTADAITVVPLNTDFRRPGAAELPARTLRKWGLKPQKYVLMVSTIESRKNHMAAFSAWLELLRKHGRSEIPQLVCVGKRGWLNADIYQKLESNDRLNEHVTMLTSITDDELALLYRNCLFTLYPSHYEGWGLPVTESLCYGKIPVLPKISSLPEAGGEFAEYFEPGSAPELLAGLEKLIFDNLYRQSREENIRSSFRPRSWPDLASQVDGAISTVLGQPSQLGDGEDFAVTTAQLGVYYPIKRNTIAHISPGMRSGEMFRAGRNWWGPEEWGVWTKPGGSEIAFRVNKPHRPLRAYFGLAGLRAEETAVNLTFDTGSARGGASGKIGADEKGWLTCDIPGNDAMSTISVTLNSEKYQDLRSVSAGADTRVTAIGFRGFYVCEIDDVVARANFIDAVVLDDLAGLESGAGNGGA